MLTTVVILDYVDNLRVSVALECAAKELREDAERMANYPEFVNFVIMHAESYDRVILALDKARENLNNNQY